MLFVNPLWTDEVRLIRQQDTGGATDEDGVPVVITQELSWAPVVVQQLSSDDVLELGDRTGHKAVYRIAGALNPVSRSIQAHDRIEWQGRTLEVVGTPDVRDRSLVEHVQIVAREDEG